MAQDNPYSSLADFHFWRRVVAGVPVAELDPVVSTSFKLDATMKVATAGSCFAQHIARSLKQQGLNFFVTEPAHPIVPPSLHEQACYGIFSARYGNIYTARQLLQLLRRASGDLTPGEGAWKTGDENFVDPLRPNVHPSGYVSMDDLEADRAYHLSCVRRLFRELDCFIFTLGLTESWESVEDQVAYPICPALFDPDFSDRKYRFVNYGFAEVRSDLQAFIDGLRSINPGAKIILTVSPVPLVATYEKQHVLCATTYSKSVLRAVAEEIRRSNVDVDYFPSFEIVSGTYTRGRYFESDLRSVTPAGIAHVMKIFMRHYRAEAAGAGRGVDAAQIAQQRKVREFVEVSAQVDRALCDEEMLDRR